jgi:hypothetical protein
MIVFYLLGPLAGVDAGFLSPLYLAAFALGLWMLILQRNLNILFLIVPLWFIGVLAYSGTNYQTHRFVLTFMPALALLVGIGTSTARSQLWFRARGGYAARRVRYITTTLAAAFVLLGICLGLAQGWRSVEQWSATHSAFNAQEQQIVALAREAVGATGEEGTPRVVCFGFSAPLYHYTRWPILDFFLHDEGDIRAFLAGPGPRLLVLPEESMSTRWAGTPTAARWQWIQSNYKLTRQGVSGGFTVYRVEDR